MVTPRWEGNRWRIQVRKDGKRYSFSSSVPGIKGRKEVQQKYEAWYYGEASGEKTVNQICKEYLLDIKSRRGEDCEAFRQYDKYIRLYILPKCNNKKICKMSTRDWQKILNEAHGEKKPLSEKTLKNLRGVIMGIIKYAYQDYQINEMPRTSLYIPVGHSKKEKEILQADEIKRLLEPSDLWYYPLFVFLLVVGCRPGEALALKLEDLEENRIIIRRSINAIGQITEGKNENARRMIPISTVARNILNDTIERNKKYNLHTDWIFCSPDGSQGSQSTMRNHWLALKKERNISGTVYSLRHTFISYMKNVMPEQMIKDIVGHSVSFSTFTTYGHLVKTDEKKAADIIDLTFGANFGDISSTSGGHNE